MIPIDNLYYLLCYAWDVLPERGYVNVGVSSSPAVLELLTNLLTSHLARQLKAGLPKRYQPVEEPYAGVKGQLLFAETLRNQVLRTGKAVCRYDELTFNQPVNQILKTTLRRIAHTKGLAKLLRQRVLQLVYRLAEVNEIELSKALFESQLSLAGRNSDRLLLHICQLLHENLFVNEQPGRYIFRNFWRDEKQMAVLFEAFVRNFYRIEQQKYRVRRETILWKFEASDEDKLLLPLMLTDVTLESAERKIIIDTKFYEETFQRRYDRPKVHSQHLYQLFSYLKNQPRTEQHVEGILLYPVVKRAVSLNYADARHRLRVETINLNQPWPNIKEALLELIP